MGTTFSHSSLLSSPVFHIPFSIFFISLLSCPLLSFSVFEMLLCHWWKPTAASKIASVLASGLKGEITENEWSDIHRLRRGRWRDGADGSVQLWEDTLPQRPFLHAAEELQGKKNAFILFQTPQTNEAAGLNCNLGKMWTFGTWKHRFWIFGDSLLFSPYVLPGL